MPCSGSPELGHTHTDSPFTTIAISYYLIRFRPTTTMTFSTYLDHGKFWTSTQNKFLPIRTFIPFRCWFHRDGFCCNGSAGYRRYCCGSFKRTVLPCCCVYVLIAAPTTPPPPLPDSCSLSCLAVLWCYGACARTLAWFWFPAVYWRAKRTSPVPMTQDILLPPRGLLNIWFASPACPAPFSWTDASPPHPTVAAARPSHCWLKEQR